MHNYDWPGNVRELRNVVESALTMGEVPQAIEQVKTKPRSNSARSDSAPRSQAVVEYRTARAEIISAFEVDYLGHLMEETEGNVSKAAALAKMNRSYLLELLKKHGLR